MSLEDAVSLVLYAFNEGLNGDIFVQKAPASTIGDLVLALKEIFNYKKANWAGLNSDLKYINWDRILRGVNAQAQWNIFSDILGKLCDKNIPKITTKSQFQPPWFDSDVHNIGTKKNAYERNIKKSGPCGLPKI